jgi:hypothetical protein
MISGANNIKHIRCDIDKSLIGKYVNVSTTGRMEYEVGDSSVGSILLIRIRVVYTNNSTLDEVVGYLCEKRGVLATSTIENDRPFLVKYLQDVLLNVSVYWSEHVPIAWPLNTNIFDVEKFVDTILGGLKEQGYYS